MIINDERHFAFDTRKELAEQLVAYGSAAKGSYYLFQNERVYSAVVEFGNMSCVTTNPAHGRRGYIGDGDPSTYWNVTDFLFGLRKDPPKQPVVSIYVDYIGRQLSGVGFCLLVDGKKTKRSFVLEVDEDPLSDDDLIRLIDVRWRFKDSNTCSFDVLRDYMTSISDILSSATIISNIDNLKDLGNFKPVVNQVKTNPKVDNVYYHSYGAYAEYELDLYINNV